MGKITWINHAGFLIETGGKRLYVDPYKLPESYKDLTADIIFISHEHQDHFDDNSVSLLRGPKTEIVCPATCTEKIEKYHAIGVSPGEKRTFQGIDVEIVPAYNPNKKFHPKEKKWVGFLITVENTAIYHAGDTDLIPEFENLKERVDIALLPVGDTYTMGFDEAIEAVGIIQPKKIIPMHHWDKNLLEFKDKCYFCHPTVEVQILDTEPLEF